MFWIDSTTDCKWIHEKNLRQIGETDIAKKNDWIGPYLTIH